MDERREKYLYALEALSGSMNRQCSLSLEFIIDSLAEFSIPFVYQLISNPSK